MVDWLILTFAMNPHQCAIVVRNLVDGLVNTAGVVTVEGNLAENEITLSEDLQIGLDEVPESRDDIYSEILRAVKIHFDKDEPRCASCNRAIYLNDCVEVNLKTDDGALIGVQRSQQTYFCHIDCLRNRFAPGQSGPCWL